MTGAGTVEADGIPTNLERPREGDRPAYVPAEELTRLVDELTVADIRRARADYPEGDSMRGFAAVFHAAKRLGLAGDDDEDAFLSRVRIVDLTPLLARANATLPEGPSGTSSSQPSAASGA